jgi:ribonuclease H / adenosylcobalamin/alpha-ribazole phosphatase
MVPRPGKVNTILFLVRHAAHADLGRRLTGRASGVNLTPAGERQAQAVAGRLSREGLDLVQTSPRERARQTAEAIAALCGVGVEQAEPVDEIDFGDWTGRDYEGLGDEPLWREWNRHRGQARCPGGESMGEAADRIAGHAFALARTRPGARIALVSHADVLRGLVSRVLGLPLDNVLRFEIAPASVSRIEIGEWGGCVVYLNETVEPEDE